MRLATGFEGPVSATGIGVILGRANPRNDPPLLRCYVRRFPPRRAQRNVAELPPVPLVPARGTDAEVPLEVAQAEGVPRVGAEASKDAAEVGSVKPKGKGKEREEGNAKGKDMGEGKMKKRGREDGWHVKFHACEECGKAFATGKKLRNHMATHSKQFVCPHDNCQRAFAFNYLLSRHLLTHCPDTPQEGERGAGDVKKGSPKGKKKEREEKEREKEDEELYTCQECEMAFSHRATFTKHMATHLKQFVCPHENCRMAFAFTSRLKRHLHIHNPNAPR
ncbi:unnamed protein product, partial [Closterium sp. NIES-53]